MAHRQDRHMVYSADIPPYHDTVSHSSGIHVCIVLLEHFLSDPIVLIFDLNAVQEFLDLSFEFLLGLTVSLAEFLYLFV